jgi:hypothetical protein
MSNALDAEALTKSVMAKISACSGDPIQSIHQALALGRNSFIPIIDTAVLTIPKFLVRELKSWDNVSQYFLEIMKRLTMLASNPRSKDFREISTFPLFCSVDILDRFVPEYRIRDMIKNEEALASLIALDEEFRHELVDHRRLFMRSSYGAFVTLENCISHFLFLEGWEKRHQQMDDWKRTKHLISYRRANYEHVIEGCGYALECSAIHYQLDHLANLISVFCRASKKQILELIETDLQNEIQSMFNEARLKRDFNLWNQAIQLETGLTYSKRFHDLFGNYGARVAAFIALNPVIEHPLTSAEALTHALNSNELPFQFKLESALERLQKISEIPRRDVPERIRDENQDITQFICNYLGWDDPSKAYSKTLISLNRVGDGFYLSKAGELFPDCFPAYVKTKAGLENWYTGNYYPSFIVWQVAQSDKRGQSKPETYMTQYGRVVISGQAPTKLLSQAFQESRIDLLPKNAIVNNPEGSAINFVLTEFERQICEGSSSLRCPFFGFISCDQCKTDFNEYVKVYEKRLGVDLRCDRCR